MSPQRRTALVSVGAACLLIAIKLVAGIASGSLGLLAEAAHSGTDLAAALVTFFAVSVAVKPADRGHPFGHAKAQNLAALAEAGFLIAVSLVIAGLAIARLTHQQCAESLEVSVLVRGGHDALWDDDGFAQVDSLRYGSP